MLRSTRQEDFTTLNVYIPNNGASKYMKHKPLSKQLIEPLDKEISKDINDLKNTLNHLHLTDVIGHSLCRTIADCTFFSSVHGVFVKIGHMLGHKTSLSKCRSTEIM